MTTSQGEMVARLLELALERGAIRYGDFTLSSGRKSSYYFDGRLLSLDPEGAYLLGHALLPLLTDASVSAVGGPTLGADPIVAAVATASWQQGTPIPAFIVRKEAKGYGMGQMIEGPLPPAGTSVAIAALWTTPAPPVARCSTPSTRRRKPATRSGWSWPPLTATRAAATPSASVVIGSPRSSPPARMGAYAPHNSQPTPKQCSDPANAQSAGGCCSTASDCVEAL